MIAFSAGILLGAFLLFQVQPIIARFILPWFGGSPAVWTACMLFFQVALLGGYLYAHLLATRVSPRAQPIVHVILLLLSAATLPIAPSQDWVPTGAEEPIGRILLLLFSSVGFPFIILSASAPLLQHWFARTYPDTSPFRLYALSNFGSLAALLTYPVLVEPRLTLSEQSTGWSVGYGVLVLVIGVCAWLPLKHLTGGSAHQHAEVSSRRSATLEDRLLWIALSACGSVILLATTNQMCQDVAVVPFLWIVPLSLYLISFIICFERDAWYQRKFWVSFFIISVSALVYLMYEDYTSGEMPLLYQVAIYSLAMFACCMVCHGELVKRRSSVSELTTFYLYVALGGALGGVFVNLIAPNIFDGFWELHGGLAATAILVGYCIGLDQKKRLPFGVAWSLGVVALAVLLVQHAMEQRDGSIDNRRSFYGVVHVYEKHPGKKYHERSFYHGRILHGSQLMSKVLQKLPTTYFGSSSGVALAFKYHPRRTQTFLKQKGLKIGVAGLGAGTVFVHARRGDHLTFYEINSQVEDIAREFFTYLDMDEAELDVVIGDARISLERELKESGSAQFDILVLDAFSGGAIPVHLLTREAFELYWQHLRPDGVLAVNFSILHIDISDVVRQLADHFGKHAIWIRDQGNRPFEKYNNWLLVTDNEDFIYSRGITAKTESWVLNEPKDIFWTDDFSNLFDVLYWE